MSKSLWDLLQGEECLVKGFKPQLTENYRIRLMELGFSPGETISCAISPSLGAPKMYRINNTCYSLDDKIAKLIETDVRS